MYSRMVSVKRLKLAHCLFIFKTLTLLVVGQAMCQPFQLYVGPKPG